MMKTIFSLKVSACLLVLSFVLLMGCNQTNQSSDLRADENKPIFSYDQAAIPDVKPWTSKEFKNNPGNLLLSGYLMSTWIMKDCPGQETVPPFSFFPAIRQTV